jgi:FkbM family methyltransferase
MKDTIPPLPFRILRRLLSLGGMKLEFEKDFLPVNLESLLAYALREISAVRFLQIGANDAANRTDPLRSLRQHGHWSGYMIEPNPSVFRRLQRNCAGDPDVQCINVAVSNTEGHFPFFVVRNPSASKHPYTADQISSLSRKHVRDELISWGYSPQEAEDRVDEIIVQCRTPSSLLTDLNITELDLLLCDAEGHDFNIISAFPLDKVRPAVIAFEISRLSDSEKAKVPDFFLRNGYSCFFIEEDAIAIKLKCL